MRTRKNMYWLGRDYQERERGKKKWKSSFQKKYIYLVDYKLCIGKACVSLLTLLLVIMLCPSESNITPGTWQTPSKHVLSAQLALALHSGVAMTKHRKRKPTVVLGQWL